MHGMTTKEMTWDEYRAQAVARSGAFDIGKHGEPRRLAYLALGLCGEAGEVVTERAMLDVGSDSSTPETLREELGDFAWYLAMIEHEVGYMIAWPADDEGLADPAVEMLVNAAAVAEAAKRVLSGRTPRPRHHVSEALDGCAAALAHLADQVGGLSEVLAASVEKNHMRFGARVADRHAP